jgi:hypothetical protein
MENNPKDTTEEVDAVVEESPQTPATEETPVEEAPQEAPETEESENSTSTEEDLDALIDAEKKRGPDPEKAKERFKKSRQEDMDEPEEEPYVESQMSREDIERLVAERTQQVLAQANEDRIVDLSEKLADSPKEAELVREIHRNRVFPVGMSLQDQLVEAHAIATAKRIQAKNVELGRKLQSTSTASRNTATTQRDPQASPAPKIASDLAASMRAAGYTHNPQLKRYEKKLPNGKILVLDRPGGQPYLAN